MRIGPSYLLKVGQHAKGEEPVILDVGGMLHKTVQLIGEVDDAVVEVSGSIDPAGAKKDREVTWMVIGTLNVAEPYKHHVGYLRWLRVKVMQGPDDARFGVALMGED